VHTVALTSYRRPELTKASLSSLTGWSNLGKLIVSIDGLRPSAPEEERQWRKDVIKVCEEFASGDPRISVRVRDSNEGLTEHVIDLLQSAFENGESALLLEEDVAISTTGLDFLASNVVNSDFPQASSAFTRAVHKKFPEDAPRKTFFPELWGMALNRAFFDSFERLWTNKDLTHAEVLQAIQISLPTLSSRRTELAADWWLRLLRFGLDHHTHQDAVFAATAMRLKVPFLAPWETFVSDAAFGDDRSLHPRTERDRFVFEHSADSRGGYCLKCESKFGRLSQSGWMHRTYEKVYWSLRRAKSITQY